MRLISLLLVILLMGLLSAYVVGAVGQDSNCPDEAASSTTPEITVPVSIDPFRGLPVEC